MTKLPSYTVTYQCSFVGQVIRTCSPPSWWNAAVGHGAAGSYGEAALHQPLHLCLGHQKDLKRWKTCSKSRHRKISLMQSYDITDLRACYFLQQSYKVLRRVNFGHILKIPKETDFGENGVFCLFVIWKVNFNNVFCLIIKWLLLFIKYSAWYKTIGVTLNLLSHLMTKFY